MKEITKTVMECENCKNVNPRKDVKCEICEVVGCYDCISSTTIGNLCRRCRQMTDSCRDRIKKNHQKYRNKQDNVARDLKAQRVKEAIVFYKEKLKLEQVK
jgi:hypothetical protein